MPSLRTIAIAMALSIGAVNAGPCNLSSSASTTSTTESSTITTIATTETVSTTTTTAASTTTSTAAGPPICDKSGTLASDSPFDTVTSSSIDVCGSTGITLPEFIGRTDYGIGATASNSVATSKFSNANVDMFMPV